MNRKRSLLMEHKSFEYYFHELTETKGQRRQVGAEFISELGNSNTSLYETKNQLYSSNVDGGTHFLMYLGGGLGVAESDRRDILEYWHLDAAVAAVQQRDQRPCLHRAVGDRASEVVHTRPFRHHLALVHGPHAHTTALVTRGFPHHPAQRRHSAHHHHLQHTNNPVRICVGIF